MTASRQLLAFTAARQRFAVPLSCVVRAMLATQVTPVPGAPAPVVGVFDLHGEVVPVLARPPREAASVRVSDQFIVLRTRSRLLALLVDEVIGVVDDPGAARSPTTVLADSQPPYEGTTRLDGELVLIHDVERFLAPQEAAALEHALEAAA